MQNLTKLISKDASFTFYQPRKSLPSQLSLNQLVQKFLKIMIKTEKFQMQIRPKKKLKRKLIKNKNQSRNQQSNLLIRKRKKKSLKPTSTMRLTGTTYL
jgi:hypothetical protein